MPVRRDTTFNQGLFSSPLLAISGYQKLIYMHNNPCAGKWKLAEVFTKYEHSSARYYITGKYASYKVTDIETIFAARGIPSEREVNVADEEEQLSS